MRILKSHGEGLIWATALLLLFFMEPSANAVSFCFFKFIGFSSCPGCGIGHAIHYALHLELRKSFQHHVLGVPATAILFMQIGKSFFKNKPKLIWTYNK